MAESDSFIFGAELDRLKQLLTLGDEALHEDPGKSPAVTTAFDNLVERPGAQLGRYRLLSILGEGGMGVVYLAEQERPVRRQVALKVIKPGMDSKRVLARFEAEQQALALMEHPHVARVHDASLTPSGRPYFVMEYVKGVSITEYCDGHRLTIEERLRLFLHVCEAVQHAHQKGIIHRDLKPSNILVIIEDERASPKVIDFGVARATGTPLTERTLCTEQGQFVGTPEYMSPEQADPGNLDIDTRSDIYSLGVVLYELLAGVLPFDSRTLREHGIDGARKVICEQDPQTPSTRLRRTAMEESTDSAQRRRTSPRQLHRRLRGDLDWIVMKAMEKDRTRRYETVNGLARDIEHDLNNEPVSARPPSTLYRFQKLVGRNKGVFAAVAVVASALVFGVVVSTWQAARATRAERMQTRLRREAEALAYASDMSLAQQALAINDLGHARRLLEAHRPASGEPDLRGWEWRYLWQECRSDALVELCRYPNSAYSVAFSPDGRVLAVAGLIQGFIELWDVPRRRRITMLQPTEGHLVAFSPQGDLLATDAGNQIRLWRTATWEPVHEFSLAGGVQVLKFSPDGRHLASLSHPGEATVWDVGQWTVTRRIPGIRLLGTHGGSLDFAPDGGALVIGDANHHLRVVDLADGNTRFDIPEAHPEALTFVAWSPSGAVIASGSGYAGGPIRLWDAASGRSLGALDGHTAWICELIFSADGLRLYSAGADQTIRIWDVDSRRCLATLRGSTDEVHGLARAPDGTTLASAGKDGVVALWNARPHPQEEPFRLIPAGQSAPPAFAPSGRVLAGPCAQTVRLFDLTTSQEIEQLPTLGTDVSKVAYSPDGTLLVSRSHGGKVRVWSCVEHRLLQEMGDPNAPIDPIGFRADGTRLLSIDAVGKAIWWDTRTWQAVQTFEVETEAVSARAVSPDGSFLVSGTVTGAVRWRNAETGELLPTPSAGHRHRVVGIAFSEDGTRAVSVCEDGTVAIWDPPFLDLIAAFKGHMQGAHAVAFSPDGHRFATGGGGRDAVKLWDLSTRRQLMTLRGESSLFGSVGFSPDGCWLAACGIDGKLHLWRAPSWEEIEAAENGPQSQ